MRTLEKNKATKPLTILEIEENAEKARAAFIRSNLTEEEYSEVKWKVRRVIQLRGYLNKIYCLNKQLNDNKPTNDFELAEALQMEVDELPFGLGMSRTWNHELAMRIVEVI